MWWWYPGEYFLSFKSGHFHARTQSFYWKRQRFKCPRYRNMIRIGKTNSTSKKGLLFHQGSTLVLELGPHKDREKLWPGWDLNPERSLLALKQIGFPFSGKEFHLVSKASLHRCDWKGWREWRLIWWRSILKTTVKFRWICLELMKATAKCFKREVEQVFRSSRIAKTSSENKTSNFCFNFSIIPTNKRCANCSGGKLVGFMRRLQEKYLN